MRPYTCTRLFNQSSLSYRQCHRHRHIFHRTKPTYVSSQRREISLFNKVFISSPSPSNNKNSRQVEQDLDRAIKLVQKYDPVGYLPGLLVTNQARIGYFAVRAFWIDSGLRFEEKDKLKNDYIQKSKQIPGIGQTEIAIPDDVRLQKWKEGIESLFNEDSNEMVWQKDGTLRLLHHVMQHHKLSKEHFDRILLGREIDVNTKHYSTVQSLKDHVEMSCGSLLYLVLECANIYQNNNDENEVIYKAAKHIGTTHGLANALRLSVPKASSTGKVIIPQELCNKYDVKSPRYLLSALGMGDEECRRHLQSAVKDIVNITRDHLTQARILRDEIYNQKMGKDALSTFLPALASETFLNRLERHQYDLTDRQLRDVGIKEHMSCSKKILEASFKKKF